MVFNPSGLKIGPDSGKFFKEQLPQAPQDPIIEYTHATNALNLDKMRLLRRHHPSRSEEFNELDYARLTYIRNLEMEVEQLTQQLDYVHHIMSSLVDSHKSRKNNDEN